MTACLAKQIAATGAADVVMDSVVAIKRFSGDGTHCLDAQRIAEINSPHNGNPAISPPKLACQFLLSCSTSPA
jgi:hypothetical protein